MRIWDKQKLNRINRLFKSISFQYSLIESPFFKAASPLLTSAMAKKVIATMSMLMMSLLVIAVLIITALVNKANNQPLQNPVTRADLSNSTILSQVKHKRQIIADLQSIRMHNVLRHHQFSTSSRLKPNAFENYNTIYGSQTSSDKTKVLEYPSSTTLYGW
ncbi:MAG: hypothetical protein ACI97K_000491 [Glaciecola sp.]|jgi:hypothetical protein